MKKVERFIQTLKGALDGLLRQKNYRTIKELQADLDEWLVWHNSERPHQGRYNRGLPPLQAIREIGNSPFRRYSDKCQKWSAYSFTGITSRRQES